MSWEIDKVLKNYDITKFFDKENIDYKNSSGGEIRICCPKCIVNNGSEDTKYHLYYNSKPNHHKRGLFNCFRCGYAGNAIHLISQIRGLSFYETLKILSGKYPKHSVMETRSTIDRRVHMNGYEEVHDIKPIDLPEYHQYLTDNIPYLKKRRVLLADIKKYKIGICKRGYYRDRIILPQYLNGKLVFWQARSILSEDEWYKKYGKSKEFKKVLNPKDSQSKKILGNFDTARKFETTIIVEGFFDMVRAGDRAMCLNGKTLSMEQYMLLALSKPKRIAIMLDANAKKEARKVEKLLSSFFDVSVVALPHDDPDSFKRRELRSFILDAFNKETSQIAHLERLI